MGQQEQCEIEIKRAGWEWDLTMQNSSESLQKNLVVVVAFGEESANLR